MYIWKALTQKIKKGKQMQVYAYTNLNFWFFLARVLQTLRWLQTKMCNKMKDKITSTSYIFIRRKGVQKAAI